MYGSFNEYRAVFEAVKDSFDVNVTVNGIDPDLVEIIGAGRYAEGDEATIGAIAADGFEFIDWNDGNTDNPRIVTVTADITYTANFAPFGNGIEDNTQPSALSPRKELRNGHVIIILPDGREFNAAGAKIQ